MKKFVESYKKNSVELELPMVNISRKSLYQEQIERQKKTSSVKIEKDKEYEVEKILNRKDVKIKLEYLVRWKEYTVDKNT